MRFFLFCLLISSSILGQNNWFLQNTTTNNSNQTDTVYRSGAVAISHAFKSPINSRFMVTGLYGTENSRGQYISLNQPRTDIGVYPLSTTTVGLATSPNANFQGLTINNYANFQSGVTFTDVHNTSLEINYQRGFPDSLGFRDGGHLQKAATARFSGSFSNNARAYQTDSFDLINLRLFTDDDEGNTANVENFYALRMENIRGNNEEIVTNGWGIYMQPTVLRNYFGGFVGVGTADVTNALTVSASENPIKLTGLQAGTGDNKLLTIDDDGVVKKNALREMKISFVNTTSNTTLSDENELYIHEGGDVIYTLPDPILRTGKSWKIVNIGTGIITTSQPFYEGNETRTSIINKSGAYRVTLFSDGTKYIAL